MTTALETGRKAAATPASSAISALTVNMSRLHVTQDSVLKAVCTHEVERAQRPITRFSSTEYQRAMSSQVQRFDRPDPDLPPTTLYVIDKMARLRVRDLGFGYDHSELLSLERVLREPFKEGGDHLKTRQEREVSEEAFISKLRAKLVPDRRGLQGHKLTFEQWKLKKEAEARIKNKLIEEAIRATEREETEEEQSLEAWSFAKRDEARRRLLEFQEKKLQLQASPDRPAAESAFKAWLKANFVQLREAKRLERMAQISGKTSSSRGRSVESGPRRIKVSIERVKRGVLQDESFQLGSSIEVEDLAEE